MTSTKTAVQEIDQSISSNILQHYVIDKRIGKGAYGIVWKAYKRGSNDPVALKKIFGAFRNAEDAQRTYREVTYLKAFKGHPNIIQLLNIHRASNNADLYLVFEYMSIDLHHYIVSGIKLDENQVRFITYQVLKALKFMHSGNVIHRDLKPSNILLKWNCVCKIADLGLARSIGEMRLGSKSPMTDYVATRWYRAPEILLKARRYSKAVDMWSLGCVLAEMVTREPLFPGKSTADQLHLIMSSVGQGWEDAAALERLGAGRPKAGSGVPLKDLLLPLASPEVTDLACRLLRTAPGLRLTAEEALSHPLVCQYRSRREPALCRSVRPRIPDHSRLTAHDYREAICSYLDQRSRPSIYPHLPFVNANSRTRNIRYVPKPFSSEPENNAFKTRVYESTRYPPLTSKTCFRGNFQSKVSLRH